MCTWNSLGITNMLLFLRKVFMWDLMNVTGCAKTSKDYNWFSSDMTTVSVLPSGLICARRPGKATIKVVSIFDSFNYDEVIFLSFYWWFKLSKFFFSVICDHHHR